MLCLSTAYSNAGLSTSTVCLGSIDRCKEEDVLRPENLSCPLELGNTRIRGSSKAKGHLHVWHIQFWSIHSSLEQFLPDFRGSERWTEVVQFAFVLLTNITDVCPQEVDGTDFVATSESDLPFQLCVSDRQQSPMLTSRRRYP